jgi:hypothetical protein
MACTDANPKRNVSTSDEDQAKCNATCFQAYFPQSCYKVVNGEKLTKCASVHFRLKNNKEGGTHESDLCDSKSTDLLDDALRCAIVPRLHDPVVSPSNIEDTSHGL